MIKYNDDNIFVGEIKQLLSTFNLPQCDVYSENKTYFVGQHFIKDNAIYLVTNNGYKKISNYKFGDYIPNITKNLEIKNMIYDSYTHKYLGNFLRFIKDYTKIDLMSMYNCFTYEIPTRLNLNINDDVFSTADLNYNIFMLPVKFGKTYTIGIDTHDKISIVCGFYSNDNLLIYSESNSFINNSYKHISGTKFNKPFTYKVPENKISSILNNQEKNLKMFIKIPKTCESSIVVLEGNYIKNCDIYIDGYNQKLGNKLFEYKNENTILGNYDYTSKLQLLSFNSKLKYLLSDRLIEYLTENVITPVDTIDNNIKKLQYKMYRKKLIDNINVLGVFDNELRKSIYKFINNTNLRNNKYDLLSYCDKDVEFELGTIDKLFDNSYNTGGIN